MEWDKTIVVNQPGSMCEVYNHNPVRVGGEIDLTLCYRHIRVNSFSVLLSKAGLVLITLA
jgi:hypothetical protein